MNTLDPRELRAKVQQEVLKRQIVGKIAFFVVSVIVFAVLVILGWGIAGNYLNTPQLTEEMRSGITTAMVMITLGGGLSVFYQAMSLFMDSKMGERSIRNQVAPQVIAREQLAGLLDDPESAEKPKRDEAYELTDDGEIQPADDYLSDAESETKRRAAR